VTPVCGTLVCRGTPNLGTIALEQWFSTLKLGQPTKDYQKHCLSEHFLFQTISWHHTSNLSLLQQKYFKL